ncbi:Uncharacterised protein [Candidatus Bilamarchaeum dharawalense]|uniref:TrbC/VIRB2 family protein n=1 Tax=Candidatus Bilamarchaeum dharawalense TaxID=2885759 RepID=A0A5E4LRQ4_9ARCH|nr:Uncharacterised protein [Candidatus Bilamarchaeum dharawalense]
MNILSYLNKVNSVGKYLVLVVLVLNLLPAVFASGSIGAALASMCSMAKLFLAVGALLMIILAGAVYAIGQIMGAETRARASVWATAMLTGAIIGALIYLVAPVIVQALIGNAFSSSC